MKTSIRSKLFDEFARIGQAVSNPGRLQLLDLLAQGEKNVETLARQSGLTVKNTSAHLGRLRAVSLVDTRRDGPYVYYRLADESVVTFLRSLEELGRRQIAEIDRLVRDYFEDPGRLETIGIPELRERIGSGDVVVIDVRPEDEYRSGHIPGAVSVPVAELDRWIDELPRGRDVVAYCRGPYCALSIEAVAALREAGFSSRRLDSGLPDWRLQGLPVEAESFPRPAGENPGEEAP